jgi:luciferase-like monooxygenase
MSSRQRASERITETVTAWPGVTAGPGRRGEFAFTLGGREIGHLHGDHAAHFAFPKSVWVDLKEQGRIDDHPVFPGRQGLGARRIESESDIDDVIALLRINYDRVVAGQGEPVGAAA